MPTLPPLSAIRVFEAAARHENYSRAAEELALTQAGVSYQIKLLEERLNARLFTRKGRGMVLTGLGQRIAPRVSEAFGMLSQAFDSARDESEAVLGISTTTTFATNWLAGRLGGFQMDRPGLAVRLDVTNTIVDLDSGDFDVAIRYGAAPTPGLVSHFVMRQVVTPMASPDFLARHPIREPRDLLSVPRLSQVDGWWTLWLDAFAGGAPGVVDAPALGFDTQVLDGQAAMAGQGVAVLNPIFFARELEAGLLVQPFDHLVTDDSAASWLVYPEHKRRLAKVRAFRDWLLREIEGSTARLPDGALLRPPPA